MTSLVYISGRINAVLHIFICNTSFAELKFIGRKNYQLLVEEGVSNSKNHRKYVLHRKSMFGCYALSAKQMSTTVYRQVAKLLKVAEPRRVQGISCIDFAINYETVENAFSLLSMHILFKKRERERGYILCLFCLRKR